MLNVMAALPNIGGALFSSRKVSMTPTTRVSVAHDQCIMPILRIAHRQLLHCHWLISGCLVDPL